MCCYTWCNWLVNDADARCHVDNNKTKQKKTTWITKKKQNKKKQRSNLCMHACARVWWVCVGVGGFAWRGCG